MPVTFGSGPRKMCEETTHAVSSVPASFANSWDLAGDMPSFQDDIIEEETPSNLGYLAFKHDCRASVLQLVHELFHIYMS